MIHTRILISKTKKITGTDRIAIDLSIFYEVITYILENKVITYYDLNDLNIKEESWNLS